MDSDDDGVVSWEEVMTFDMGGFLKKFINILHLPPHLDRLKEYLRKLATSDTHEEL